jgi:hypothetical protein
MRDEVALIGCGAVGSYMEAACAELGIGLSCVDLDVVTDDSIGVASYGVTEIGQSKARVLAARRRGRGGVAHALHGDVRYVIGPSFARGLSAAVLCLDNPGAILDACSVLWRGARERLVLLLACGNASRPGYLARHFVTPDACAACLNGAAARRAIEMALAGASCTDTSAPRASAASAAAAARAGGAFLGRWLAGDRSLAHCRVQSDGGEEYVVRMPRTPSDGCDVPHHDCGPGIELGGTIATLSVGTLAERARAAAGEDAEILLGRRGIPLDGLYCPACGVRWDSPPLLVPAAVAAPRPCACAVTPRPLGERHAIAASELDDLDGGALTLRAWGAAHGDEFLAVGSAGQARLRAAFQWEDIDDEL